MNKKAPNAVRKSNDCDISEDKRVYLNMQSSSHVNKIDPDLNIHIFLSVFHSFLLSREKNYHLNRDDPSVYKHAHMHWVICAYNMIIYNIYRSK
jgi:hypothetical protein